MTRNELRIPRSGEVWDHCDGGRYIIDKVETDTEEGTIRVAYYREADYETFREQGPDAVAFFSRRLDVFLGSTKRPGGHVNRFTFVRES